MDNTPYIIKYEFQLKDGSRKHFEIELDPVTISMIQRHKNQAPPWTRLVNKQCECCPLDPKEHPYCPIAVNLSEVVDVFKGMMSSEDCIVYCYMPERTCFKETSLQQGLYSIFGIIMATSNCPIMDLFKPMARFHLPFSTIQETLVRSTSIYLLRQYFAYKKGRQVDFDLKRLDHHYSKVQVLNQGILNRIRSYTKKDADKNAIIILHSLAQLLTLEINESLNSIEYLFNLAKS